MQGPSSGPTVMSNLNRRIQLEDALQYLLDGSTLSDGRVSELLTASEYRLFIKNLKQCRLKRCVPDISSELKASAICSLAEYLRRVRDGDRVYKQAERHSRRGARNRDLADQVKARPLFRKAEGLYDYALEALSEAVEDEPMLRECLDRTVGFQQNEYSEAALSYEGMPRPIWSALAKKSASLSEATLRQLQTDAVRNALHKLL